METDQFYEEQKFNQKWIKILIYFILIILAALSFILIYTGKLNWILGMLPSLFGIILFIFFISAKLKTIICDHEIIYQFIPFQFTARKIKKEMINSIKVINYDPLSEYGGWGIRFNGNEWAYTTSGNFGIKIKLNTGKQLIIGTSRPKEVTMFLEKYWLTIFQPSNFYIEKKWTPEDKKNC
ncbi:MAG: hypothetical protein ACR2FN_01080 [Chitinophagaceae bacterium]